MPLDPETLITPENSITLGDIPCWDLETEESFDRYDSSAVRKLMCRWTDRANLINYLNPGATQIGGMTLFGAQTYPEFNSLFPQRFKTKGIGKLSVGTSGMVAYEYAIVTAEYRAFNAGNLEIDYGANVITLPKSGPCLESDEDLPAGTHDVPFQDTPGKPVAVIHLCQGKNNVPVLPMSLIRDIAKNPINEKEFFGYEPGTVIFDGGRARKLTVTNARQSTGSGNALIGPFDVEYRFIARPEMPWDSLPFRDPNTGEFSFKKVRFKNGDPYIGRSNYDPLYV